MLKHKATLVQDIYEFVSFIRPVLNPLMEIYTYGTNLSEEDILKWIISKEIGLIYNLFPTDFFRNTLSHEKIYTNLRSKLQVELSSLVTFYIKAPRLYSDNNDIELQLVGHTLYLKYYTHTKQITFKDHNNHANISNR